MATVVRRDKDDEELALEANAAAKREHEQLLADVRDMINSPSGSRFFQWFFRRGMLFSTTFTGNSHGYFLEGGRNLALQVFNVLVQAAPVESLTALIVELKEGDDVNGDGKRAQ